MRTEEETREGLAWFKDTPRRLGEYGYSAGVIDGILFCLGEMEMCEPEDLIEFRKGRNEVEKDGA